MKQLILIEGLPGTGKTTVAAWLSDLLEQKGGHVTLLREGDERIPCDFYETAGIPKPAFELLCLNHPEDALLLRSLALCTEHYAFVRIDRCAHLEAELRQWDMGDEENQRISVSDYIPCALERLDHWTNAQTGDDSVVLIDSGFLQNPINELLFRKASDAQVRDFIGGICRRYERFHPVCVYLRRAGAEEAIAFAKQAKGSAWAERIDSLLRTSGVPDLFAHRFALELEMFPTFRHVLCRVAGDDWTEARRTIREYFSL